MHRSSLFLGAALLAGCAAGPAIDTTYTSANQDSRVQYLVLHFTAEDWPSSIKTLTQPSTRPVSAHYLVRDDPVVVYRLVDERQRAWHAGVSSWRGNTQLNSSSIGIEIVNLGDKGSPPGKLVFQDYAPGQLDAVVSLVKDIVHRYAIRPENVVGHSDIAPLRRVDPGPKFPWKRLADEGLIRWPDAAAVAQRRSEFEASLPDIDWFQEKLARVGYSVPRNGQLDEATVRVLSVFQMKYRPAHYDGMPDAETAALLDVLAAQ
jgi:N-acetylmuramoyl-L-alanine amidase